MLDALDEYAGFCPRWVHRRVDPTAHCWRTDRFFQMYLSSREDTEKREVDDKDVGTILFTPIRPEFRGPVRRCCVALLVAFASLSRFRVRWQAACFLASTSAENRHLFFEVC